MNFLDLFPSIDLFILFLFGGVVVLHFVFLKKHKLFLNFVSIYTAFFLSVILPIFSTKINSWLGLHSLARIFGFLLALILLYIVLSFSNLGDFSKKVTPTEWSISFWYRLGIVGLFFSTVIYFLPSTWKVNFGMISNTVFNNSIAMLVWFVIPIMFAFAYRFKTRRGWIE